VRARELIPQLKLQSGFEPGFVFEGLDRIMWGLVQKNVIANTLSMWVDKGFATGGAVLSTGDAWLLACAYALQIYFDFAGYTSIAIGAARLIGVTLPENFRYPYHASSPADFWLRWHMSLSRWIRDYLFFRINAKHKGAPGRLYISLVGVMALVGLWHGAGWGFVLWGAMHGTYMVLYRAFDTAKQNRPALADSHLVAIAWRLFTLIAVIAAWVPFRANVLSRAGSILASMFIGFSGGFALSPMFYGFTGFIALFCVLEPWIAQKLADIDERQGERELALTTVVARPVVYACALVLFVVFSPHKAEFIYFQF
jgi:D-alanyl-lipoteichoic acid acyltransferase DltB (MBOAT superfamily)